MEVGLDILVVMEVGNGGLYSDLVLFKVFFEVYSSKYYLMVKWDSIYFC